MRNRARSIPIGVALLLGLATAQADPPARVGRLSLVEGEVTVHDTRTGESDPATLNWPVTGGIAIATARGARAEVRIGSTAIRLDGATELEFAELDDAASLLRLAQGTVSVRVRDRETARTFTLDTPQARALLLEPGSYRFDANPRTGAATVTAFQGGAQITVGGAAVAVSSGRRAEIGSRGQVEIVGAFADGFDDWASARDRGDDVAHSTRYVSREMTGYESLDEHGDWRATSEYGVVWVPRAVPVGWAPYRWGRWAWIEPWGWTWIDEAPWGFAPFHYGRWALIGSVWAWAPGGFVARPVYAPALVGWIGHPGWSVTVSFGAVPAVGWFPLAPREVFVPAYRCSTVYVRNVNITHVTHVAHAPRPHFAHRHVAGAVTVVPASALRHGHPVARSHVRARHADHAVTASSAPPEAVARPPRRSGDGRRARDDARSSSAAEGIVRAAPVARPSPDVVVAPAPRAPERDADRRPPATARPDAHLRADERNRRREPPPPGPELRAVAPAPTVVQPLPGPAAAPAPRAPERAPATVRSEGQPRVDRAPAQERLRDPNPPRRDIEHRPAPARVERHAERERPPAWRHQPPAPQSPSQVVREVPPQRVVPAVRAAPPGPAVAMPQLALPQPSAPRGDGARGHGRERRGGERSDPRAAR